jgi:hypothetical protein
VVNACSRKRYAVVIKRNNNYGANNALYDMAGTLMPRIVKKDSERKGSKL